MPVPKGPRHPQPHKPMSIRELARKLTREEQLARGNDADGDDDFHDEVYAPPHRGSRAMSLREGAARMMASDLGIDPDLAAKAGPAAAKVLGALSDANEAEDSAEKANCIRRAQKHLRIIDPARHGPLVQQLQARLLAAQGRGGDTEVAHVTPGELVLPPDLQTPELMALLQDAAAARGIDMARLFVGSADNSINPKTGTAEFLWNPNGRNDSGTDTIFVTGKRPAPVRLPGGFRTGGGGLRLESGRSGDGSGMTRPIYNPPKVTNYFDRYYEPLSQLAADMGVPVEIVIAQALAEGGWEVGTPGNNNNVFGFSKNESPLTYQTPEASIDAFRNSSWFEHLKGVQNVDDYLKALRTNPIGQYNSVNPKYDENFMNVFRTVNRRLPAWMQQRPGS